MPIGARRVLVSGRNAAGGFSLDAQTLEFGRKTLAGAGGTDPVHVGTITSSSIDSGTDADHWAVSSAGVFTPSATGVSEGLSASYTLTCTFNGVVVVITIDTIANTYSALPSSAQIEAAAADASDDDTILVRAGTLTGDLDLSSLTFTAGDPLVIRAEGAVEHASDPRQSTRPVQITGLVSVNGSTGISLDGLKLFGNADPEGADPLVDGDGVLDVGGSTSITINNCEIYSVGSMTDMLASAKIAGVVTDAQIQRAIQATGGATDLSITDNYIHDIFTVIDFACDGFVATGNWCENMYAGFIATSALTNGSGDVEVYDNIAREFWCGNTDTNTINGAAHAGMGGGSGVASKVHDNIKWIGNVLDHGFARYNWDGAVAATTGVKFNDPSASGGYSNITFALNTLRVGSSVSLEITGTAVADIANNTILRPTGWSGAGFTGVGAIVVDTDDGIESTDIRIYNNIVETISPRSDVAGFSGENDATDDIRLINNSFIKADQSGAITGGNSRSDVDYFTGTLSGTMTIEEIEAAYVPKAWTHAKAGTVKQGALGTGYYTRGDGGVHTIPAFAIPAANSGTSGSFSETVWSGDANYRAASTLSVTDGRVLTLLWQGSFTASGSDQSLWQSSNGAVRLYRIGAYDTIRFILEKADGDVIIQVETLHEATTAFKAGEVVSLAASVDLNNDRVCLALNGRPVNLIQITPNNSDVMMVEADIALNGVTLDINGTNSGTEQLNGTFEMAALDQRFVDLDTEAGLEEIYGSAGTFLDLSADGWLIYLSGDAATVGTSGWQTGTGPEFTTKLGSGTVTDDYDVIAWGNSLVGSGEVPNFDSEDGSLGVPPDYDTEFTIGSVQATTDSSGTTSADRWPEKWAATLGRSSSDVNKGNGGEDMAQITDRIQAASAALKARHTIIWVANNSTDDASYVTTVLPEIDAAVTALGHSRFLLIPPTRGGSVGGAREAIEEYCFDNYPNNMIFMFDHLCSLAGTTSPPFAGDATDVAGGRIGRALRRDSQHLNARGCLAVHNVAVAWTEAIEGGKPYIMPPFPDFVQPDDDIASTTVIATMRWFGTPTSWSFVSGNDDNFYSIANGVITRSATAGTLENTTLVVKATNAAGDSNTLSVVLTPNITAAAMSTPILMLAATSASVPDTASVRYLAMNGGRVTSPWGTSESDTRNIMPIAGTLKNLTVRLATAPSPGTWTFRVMVNGSVAGSDLVMTGSDVEAVLSGTIVTVAEGDTVSIRCTPSSSPAGTWMQMAMEFASDASEGPLFGSGSTLATADATTEYLAWAGHRAPQTTNAAVAVPMPTDGVIDKLYIKLTAAPGASRTRTFTLMKNGSTTGLTLALTGSGSGAGITFGSDLSNSVSFSAGDTIALQEVISGGAAASATVRFSARWTPTIPGESVLLSLASSTLSSNRYLNMNGIGAGGDSTEADTYNIAPVAFTLKKARGLLSAAPGGATARTMTARKEAADTALVLAFGSGDTTKADTSNDVSVAAGDTLAWHAAVTSAPAAATVYLSAVAYIPPA